MAATTAVTGVALLGASLGGMASVDAELAASVSPVSTARLATVASTPDATARAELRWRENGPVTDGGHGRSRGDCRRRGLDARAEL